MPGTPGRVVNVLRDRFLPYDMAGPLQEDIRQPADTAG